MSDNYYRVVVSRVRSKIEQLDRDIESLEHHESLADEVRDAICND